MTSPKDDLEELKPDVGDGGALTSPDEERAEDVSVVALVDESAMQTRRTQEGAGAAAVDVGAPRIPDGEHWLRAKIVRAQMERKRDRYVWRRWF